MNNPLKYLTTSSEQLRGAMALHNSTSKLALQLLNSYQPHVTDFLRSQSHSSFQELGSTLASAGFSSSRALLEFAKSGQSIAKSFGLTGQNAHATLFNQFGSTETLKIFTKAFNQNLIPLRLADLPLPTGHTFESLNATRHRFVRMWPAIEAAAAAQLVNTTQWQSALKEAEEVINEGAEKEELQATLDRLVKAIEYKKEWSVKVVLMTLVLYLISPIYSSVTNSVIDFYVKEYLQNQPNKSHKEAKKTINEIARTAIEPSLLEDFRYVKVNPLVVHQNPRALSPEVGRLTFGKVVRLLKKDTDFSLIVWADTESGAEIRGWVFSRHLSKFN